MLSSAESSFAVGDVQSALKHLNEFLRTCDPSAASEAATKELYSAKLLRGRIYLTLAQMRNEDRAEERSRYRLDDIDKVTLCEMSINDATDAISILPHDSQEAHSIRCQAAACGVPSRLRGFCIQALCLNPEDELLQALLKETKSADGRAEKEGGSHSRRQPAAPPVASKVQGSTANKEAPQDGAPVECEGTHNDEGMKTKTAVEVEESEEVDDEVEDDDTAEVDCSLCMRLLLEPITTPCGHTFCRGCLCRALDYADTSRNPQAFLSKGRQCPLCRSPLHLDAFTHPVTLIVERFIENHYPKQLQKRRLGEKAEAAATAQAAPRPTVERQGSTSEAGDGNSTAGGESTPAEEKSPSTASRSSSTVVVPQAPPAVAPVQSVFPVFGVCDVLPGHHYEFLVFEPRYRLLIRRVMQGSRVLAIALESTVVEAQRRLATGNSTSAPGGYPPVLVSCRILDTATDGMGRIALYVRALQRYTIERVWEEDAYYVTSCLPYTDQPPTDTAAAPSSAPNASHAGGNSVQVSTVSAGRTAEETKTWYKESIKKLREICVRYYKPSNATEAAKIPDENWDPELASFWFARHFLTDSSVQWWCLRIRNTTERFNKILRAAGIQTG